jgi:hypothetical protein
VLTIPKYAVGPNGKCDTTIPSAPRRQSASVTKKWPLNEGQIPHSRVVRVALGARYNRVEGNRRASRNGLVSLSLTPKIPTANPYRNFPIMYACVRTGLAAVLVQHHHVRVAARASRLHQLTQHLPQYKLIGISVGFS